MKVKFWLREINTFLEFTFSEEYDVEKVVEDIDSYYFEYLNPDEAGVEEEMLDEIETSTLDGWIIDHMYDCGDYEIEDVDTIHVDEKMGDVITLIESNINELEGYLKNEEYDDIEKHDCKVAIETYRLVLDKIKKLY